VEVAQIVGLSLVVVVVLVVLRQVRPEFALQLSVAFSVLILLVLASRIGLVVSFFADLGRRVGLEDVYLKTVCKVIAIAYLAEFSGQVCRDAGEGAVAAKVELAAKVTILLLAAPVIVAVLDAILGLIP